VRKTIGKGLIFVLLPLFALELGIRAGALDRPPAPWYDRAIEAACRGKVDFVFVGSSRVAAAINSDAFAQEVSREAGTRVRAINIGRGYTTLAEHYLLLRALYQECAANLKGATVLIEAAEGLPEFSTLRDPWVHPDQPGLIVPVIDGAHVLRMWMGSATPLHDKIEVSVRLLQVVDYIDGKRRRLLAIGNSLLRRINDRITDGNRSVDSSVDLSSSGGVLTDRAAVARARKLAVELATTAKAHQVAVENWSATVLMDINALVRAYDGRVVVFRMPLSSVQRAPLSTPTRRADAESFRREAFGAGVEYLPVTFSTTDEDFPDYWHLRKSRADEFSRRVAAEYFGTQDAPRRTRSGSQPSPLTTAAP
jgi:hypothetical protein